MTTGLTNYKAGAVRAGPEESWNLAAALTEDMYRKRQQEALERIISDQGWEERPMSILDLLDEVELESQKIAAHREAIKPGKGYRVEPEDLVDCYGRPIIRKPWWKFWRKK